MYCLQWAHYTMGPNEQNQHLTELRQKVGIYVHTEVIVPDFDGKHKLSSNKKDEKTVSR